MGKCMTALRKARRRQHDAATNADSCCTVCAGFHIRVVLGKDPPVLGEDPPLNMQRFHTTV